jgi:protein phosphatase
MKIPLPVPSLVLLLGVSGSGKSTFARRLFQPTEILSSDHCRALVCDDENNQAVNKEAFEILHLIAARRLAQRKLTVIDATNVQAAARQTLLALARAQQLPAVAIVFAFAPDVCLAQNAQRLHRVVDREVIVQQQHDLQQSLTTLADEGFHSVFIFTTPAEAAAATMQRKKLRLR